MTSQRYRWLCSQRDWHLRQIDRAPRPECVGSIAIFKPGNYARQWHASQAAHYERELQASRAQLI